MIEPHPAERLLHDLGDAFIDDGPTSATLIGGAARLRRRQTRRRLVTVTSATAALIIGTWIVGSVLQHASTPQQADPVAPVPSSTGRGPDASAGERLVAMGRVALAVPSSWELSQPPPCPTPDSVRPRVFFYPITQGRCYAVGPDQRPGPRLGFARLTSADGRRISVVAITASTIDGVAVRTGFAGPRTLDVVVPSQDVAIEITAGARSTASAQMILASLRVLAADQTSVPYIPAGGHVAVRRITETLASAGLTHGVLDPRKRYPFASTDPAAGSVVATGSQVRLDLELPDPCRTCEALLGLQLYPAVVKAGATVLVVPDDVSGGYPIAYDLDRRSTGPLDPRPATHVVLTAHRLGLLGTHPAGRESNDLSDVQIPASTSWGTYELCAHGTPEQACAVVRVYPGG